MANKQKGVKNKNLTKAVISAGVAGTILAGSAGFGIYNHFRSRPQTDTPSNNNDGYIGDTFDDIHNNPILDGITTEPNSTVPPSEFDTFEPVQDDDIITEDNLDETTARALELLTDIARDYFESVTGRKIDLTQQSYEYFKSDTANSGLVTVYGKCTVGSKTKRIATTIELDTTQLADCADPNEFNEAFVASLENAVSLPQANMSVKVENYYVVTNVNIAKRLLQNRLNTLKTSNSSSEEIAYIKNLLSEPEKLELLIVNPSSTETDYGDYKNKFTLLLSTSEYGYTAQGEFNTQSQLRADDKYPTIENYVASNISNIELHSTPQTNENKMLYQINEMTDLQNEDSFTK